MNHSDMWQEIFLFSLDSLLSEKNLRLENYPFEFKKKVNYGLYWVSLFFPIFPVTISQIGHSGTCSICIIHQDSLMRC